ncbi:hypothetical protein A8926_4675 [Saccharopolyspora spinosa]|uniref:Uncharacterized protein n=1 Tax=Saccharopolyspora spinosa TaxID=60894 RepID=A0A2N3Y1N5_SACSN|nr:hypothetical protein A8926_4675 [Saccharopolyspora spinosa]
MAWLLQALVEQVWPQPSLVSQVNFANGYAASITWKLRVKSSAVVLAPGPAVVSGVAGRGNVLVAWGMFQSFLCRFA